MSGCFGSAQFGVPLEVIRVLGLSRGAVTVASYFVLLATWLAARFEAVVDSIQTAPRHSISCR